MGKERTLREFLPKEISGTVYITASDFFFFSSAIQDVRIYKKDLMSYKEKRKLKQVLPLEPENMWTCLTH